MPPSSSNHFANGMIFNCVTFTQNSLPLTVEDRNSLEMGPCLVIAVFFEDAPVNLVRSQTQVLSKQVQNKRRWALAKAGT